MDAFTVLGLTHEVREVAKLLRHYQTATKRDLEKVEIQLKEIMATVSEFVKAQKSFNDRQSAAVDSIVASFAGLSSDIADLNNKIVELQNSPGGVTAEDQVLIDALQAQGQELVDKAEAVAANLAKLDSAQSPALPPTA